LIGGSWIAPVKCRVFRHLKPGKRQSVLRNTPLFAKQIELALDAAHAAKDAWGKISIWAQSNILLKIADCFGYFASCIHAQEGLVGETDEYLGFMMFTSRLA
jgi:acyl-CoA reductase-like NAD-dependent aldehyde dehydrogenase